MWIFARGESRKAQESQKRQRGTFCLCPQCAVSPGCELGFIPLLTSIWTLFTVVLEESGLKLSFCSGRENFWQINTAESGRVRDPSPRRQHPSSHECMGPKPTVDHKQAQRLPKNLSDPRKSVNLGKVSVHLHSHTGCLQQFDQSATHRTGTEPCHKQENIFILGSCSHKP